MKLTFDQLTIDGELLTATAGGEPVTPVLSLALSGELDIPLPGAGVVDADVLADLSALEAELRQRGTGLIGAADKLAALVAKLRSFGDGV
jgi:hypothetical protein